MDTLHKDYYTYAYLREDKTPYYIGKGRGKRISSTQRTIKAPKDKSLILFLKKGLTEAEAFKHEVYMIFVLGRKDLGTGILRNLTNGGEGASGNVKSAETRKKISKALSGEKHPQFGVPRTEDDKKKISEALSGEKNPCYGRTGEKHPQFGVPLTEETKKKISAANSGEKHPNYGNTGALNPLSKPIIATEPDGTQRHFGSVHEAARELKTSPNNLRYFLKNGHVSKQGKWKGWQFLFKNSENFSG